MTIFVIEQINYGVNSGGTRAFYRALKTWVLGFKVHGAGLA